MLKKIGAISILLTLIGGLLTEARVQVSDNGKNIIENKKEIEVMKLHQKYNTDYFVEIKKSLEKLNEKVDGIKNKL